MIKKLALSAVALSAVALVAACSQESGGAPDQQNQAANAVQDGASGIVGAAAAPAGATTTEGFVTNAAIGGMYEVEAGRIAAQRSKTPAVKAFAQKMVAEHTAAGDELKPIAAALNVPAPTMLDERHKGLIDNLRGASDQDFDKVYLDQQEAAHDETASLLENYGRMGSEVTLKAWAAKMLPVVNAHKALVDQLDEAGADKAH